MTKTNESKPTPTRSVRFNFLFFIIAILLINVLQSVFLSPFRPSKATYSEFRRAVEAGLVTEVAIGEKEVIWSQPTPKPATTKETTDSKPPAATTTPPQPAESKKPTVYRYRADRIPGIPDETILTELLAKDHQVEILGVPPDTFWPTILSWVVPTLLFVGLWFFLAKKLSGAARGALSLGRSQAKIWDESSEKVTFADVAGADEAVVELREVVDFLKNGEKYTKLGARIPKGILLLGPPGTGKTLIAKATAGEAGVPFFSMSGADFVEMFVGVGAARVRDLFKQARAKAPCIIFIDEIDTIGKTRSGAKSFGSHEEREQTLNQLLVEMDGFDSSSGVILMAATNRPEVLDRALLRPGRFDRQVGLDPPDLNGREAILKVHAKAVKLGVDVDLRALAARTPGFAGAQLANVINEGALLAVRAGRDHIVMDDLDEAIDRVMAGLERKSRALGPKEREIVAYHEMGHAFCAVFQLDADPVHKVSIIPRGNAALGLTIQAPLEDRYLLTENELHARMTVLLGGRAAEGIIFEQVSTGASDDLQRATGLARHMIVHFGMNDTLGPIALEEASEDGNSEGFVLTKRYSDETARLIDAEIKKLVEKNYERAKDLIREHLEAFRILSKQLLEREVMDGDELREALNQLGKKLTEKTRTSAMKPNA